MTGLSAVAAWDPPLVRRAVGGLAAVAGGLPRWRARLEGVGRDLETARCWSGPAARSAAAAVVDLSAVATAVEAALADSLDQLSRLAGAAAAAHDSAVAALALADAAGVALDEDSGEAAPVPQPRAPMAPDQAAAVADLAATATRAGALAADALHDARVAAAAADAAEAALLPVGGIDAGAPATFPDLRLLVPHPVPVPAPPRVTGPERVAGWWAGLSAAAQRAVVTAEPEAVGSLDGVPAWARDQANRLLLARALADPGAPGAAVAAAVSAVLVREEAAGRRVQLWTFDGDRVAVALGDLDTAAAVGLLVPGIRTTVPDDLARQVGNARDVAAAARAATPGLAVATVAWLGYRTPQQPREILTRGDARRGGAILDRALDGLAAARRATVTGDPRTTVLAHSYGTVVVAEAAGERGRLAADAVVLLGSPGVPGTAAALEAPEVYDAASVLDPVSYAGWFGRSPWLDEYGATELPADRDTLHSEYYDRDRPTLAAMAEVVARAGGAR